MPNEPIDSQGVKLVYRVQYIKMIFYLILYLPNPGNFVPILSVWQNQLKVEFKMNACKVCGHPKSSLGLCGSEAERKRVKISNVEILFASRESSGIFFMLEHIEISRPINQEQQGYSIIPLLGNITFLLPASESFSLEIVGIVLKW